MTQPQTGAAGGGISIALRIEDEQGSTLPHRHSGVRVSDGQSQPRIKKLRTVTGRHGAMIYPNYQNAISAV